MRSNYPVLVFFIALFAGAPSVRAQSVVPNDNRAAGGVLRNGVLEFTLDARVAGWRPDADVDSAVTVFAFASDDGVPRVPGPLLRTHQDSRVSVTLRNSIPDSVLIVHGLRAGTSADDTLHVAPGATRRIEFVAAKPGTFLYWASTGPKTMQQREGRDAQLTGAIIIDPPGARPDPAERIFVITLIQIEPDTVTGSKEDIWEIAVNGLSWPHSERLTYEVNDTVRWRWINGSDRVHPMHLHGFHFRMLAKGNGVNDVQYAENAMPFAVTEFMQAGSTFRMDWVPTRAGNWLMHCHMAPHIIPFPARTETARGHDIHDVAKHPLNAMAGLVMGITTVERAPVALKALPAAQRLRLFVQQSTADSGYVRSMGFVLQHGAEPRADSTGVPGSPLILTRGVTTEITVHNRLNEPTAVHWHGMELQSVYDGVPGWSGREATLAPMVAPGDSFTVWFTPPRAGTYMYHTHMDEERQLRNGLYGPMLVLEPGEKYDPKQDLIFMIGRADTMRRAVVGINGRSDPAPLQLRVGTTYRLRIVNILPAAPMQVRLLQDSTVLTWTAHSKDGADLPKLRRTIVPARLVIGVGETYDFLWTPTAPVDAVFEVRGFGVPQPLLQRLRVTSPSSQ